MYVLEGATTNFELLTLNPSTVPVLVGLSSYDSRRESPSPVVQGRRPVSVAGERVGKDSEPTRQERSTITQ